MVLIPPLTDFLFRSPVKCRVLNHFVYFAFSRSVSVSLIRSVVFVSYTSAQERCFSDITTHAL